MVLKFAGLSSGETFECRLLASIKLVGECNTALPIGKEALRLLGGKESASSSSKKKSDEFPDELIVIPVGITPQNLKNYTLYDMLGFGSLADSAGEEAIRKAYHKAVLMYHPDKAQYKSADGKEDRSVFLKIQEAFNVLTNEDKRRAYDSQLPFDESIPDEAKVLDKMKTKGDERFFKFFDPVFKRNARFAVKKPVPDLGDINTPMTQVRKFYDYWVRFESWRDFTGVDCEYKPDDAGSRDEKRWMQKENAKISVKKKKTEMDRLIRLVLLSQKLDPRLRREMEAKKNSKEAEKAAKEADARQKIELEEAIKAWSEASDASADAVPLTKAEKEKLKKAESKARNILRKLLRISADVVGKDVSKGEYGFITDTEMETLCTHCDIEALHIMNNSMGGEPASKDASAFIAAGQKEVMEILTSVMELQNRDKDDEKTAKEIKKRELDEKNNSKGSSAPKASFEDHEIELIKKAVARYPAGTANRWVLIYNYVNDQIGLPTLLSAAEIMKAAYFAFNSPQ